MIIKPSWAASPLRYGPARPTAPVAAHQDGSLTAQLAHQCKYFPSFSSFFQLHLFLHRRPLAHLPNMLFYL